MQRQNKAVITLQFNSILVYLRANLTAQKPITKSEPVLRSNKKRTNKYKVRQFVIIIIIIIIIIIP
jgi:t-SNARE complex subunit (syntaxin)